MTPPASLLADVTDALLSIFTDALDVPVLDGPQIQPPTDRAFLLVGASEIESGNGQDAQSDTNRSDMGNGEFREATGFVTCAAYAWSGSVRDTSTVRRTALGLVDDCARALEADPTLGGVLLHGHYADIGSTALMQEQIEGGFMAHATFSVTYTALLT